MAILFIHVSSDASESEHQQAREALALALSVDPEAATHVTSEPVTSERVAKASGNGAPAKGSAEAKARMARAREAKAAKASGGAVKASKRTSKASERIAALAAKAGLVAEPEPAPVKASKASKATAKRFTLPDVAADLSEAAEATLEQFAGRLVDQRKLTALVLYLQGKHTRGDLEDIPSRGGNLAEHAERAVRRAEREAAEA